MRSITGREFLLEKHCHDLHQQLAEAQQRIECCEVEIASRSDWIQKLQTAIGYDNSDGKHCQPDPIQMVEAMKQRIATLEEQVRIGHKVRNYVAFVLAGSEGADVQIAADRITEEKDRLQAQLTEAGWIIKQWDWFYLRDTSGMSTEHQRRHSDFLSRTEKEE